MAIFLALMLTAPDTCSVGRRVELSTTGSTRGTAYAMSNKVLHLGTKLHVAWLDSVSNIMIRTLDLETGQWTESLLLGVGVDNHSGPSLASDSKGYLHVVFGPHHDPMTYRKSLRPNDASAWTEPITFGERLTYPSLVCGPDDTLYMTARGGPNPPALVLHRKPAGGVWSDRITILDPNIPPGYTQYSNSLAVDGQGRLHLGFHLFDQHEFAAGKLAGYLRSDDGGDTWRKADGTLVPIPCKRDQVDLLEHDAGLDCRVGGLTLDAAGNPYLLVNHGRLHDKQPWLWHHDGAVWRHTDLGPAIQAIIPGGIGVANGTCSMASDGTLYIAYAVTTNGKWGDPSAEVVALCSTDQGQTFHGLLVSEPDPKSAQWLPSIERNVGHNPVGVPWLIWTGGLVGEGTKPDTKTAIRAAELVRGGP